MVEFSSQLVLKNEANMDWQDPIYLNAKERKCGEIILLENTKFWLVCTFCDERFHSIVIFRNHIKGIHITDVKNIPDIKNETPVDVSPNENLHIIKCDSDGRNEDCYSEVGDIEASTNLISEPSCNITNDEYQLVDEEDCNNKIQDSVQSNISDNNEIREISSRKNHKSTKTKIKESKDIKTIPESKQFKRNRRNKGLICKDIDDLLPTRNSLKKKKRQKKVYSCSFCEHIGRDKISLEAHMRSHHGTGTRHQCEECGKCFRNGSNLRVHMIIHSGERPYKCDFCDSGFSHPNNLKTHRYIHTGERPYKCDQCDRGFIASSWLKIHMREHTGETPFVCKFCEKGFASKCSYNKHMISHSGRRAHACQQCEKSFLHKETLTKHMACHSSEKQFVCDICPKKFNHKKNLVQHLKLHSNIRQYICKICSKDFAQYAGLYSHMKYHKNKE